MPFVLVMSLFVFSGVRANAAGKTRICSDRLTDVSPAFDRDVRLVAEKLSVTYRGITFLLTTGEYLLLQIILSAPREVITYDDLNSEYSGFGNDKRTLYTIGVTQNEIRRKFKRVDPTFDRLKVARGLGLYWARSKNERIVVGRLGVAKHIHEGYVDDHAVTLSPAEHAMLTALLNRDLVEPGTIDMTSENSFNVTACTLNIKLEPLLRQRIYERGPRHQGSIQLSRSLRRQASRR